LSLEADAQPTIDETMTCGSSTLEEVVSVVKTIESNQQETTQEIKEVKKQLKEEINGVKTLVVGLSESADSNETTLEEVVNMVKVIALNQQENAKEIRDLKRLLVSVSVKTNETSLETVVKEIKDEVKTLLAAGCDETNDTRLEDVVNEVKEVKRLLTSNDKDCETVRPQTSNLTTQPTDVTALDIEDPSKQALVSALLCEYLVMVALWNRTDHYIFLL